MGGYWGMSRAWEALLKLDIPNIGVRESFLIDASEYIGIIGYVDMAEAP